MPIAINGTTGISGVDGSASAPALQGSDSNTGVSFGADTVNINTGGSTRATVDSSGNLGVGETSPLGKLHSKTSDSGGSAVSYANELVLENSSDGGMTILTGNTRDGSIAFGDDGNNVIGRIVYNHNVNAMHFNTNGSERVRIDSSGSLFIGTSSAGNTGSYFQNDGNDRKTLNVCSSSTASQNQILFRNPNDRVGSIQTSGTSTSYNTTFSDVASKKNFEDWTEDVLSLFKNINPQKFNFKVEDDTASKSKGFIAQEMVDKFPEAYVKQEDEMYMFNPSGMAVYLMKALQEAIAKIEVLETKVAALEAA